MAMVCPALEARAAERVAAGGQIVDGALCPGRLHADGADINDRGVIWERQDALVLKALAREGKAHR